MRARLLLVAIVAIVALPGTAGSRRLASAADLGVAHAQAPVNVAELAARFMACALGPEGQLIATVDEAEIRSIPSHPGSLGIAETLYTWRRASVPAEGADRDRPITYREVGNGEAVIMTFYTENGALVNRMNSICWQVAWDPNYQVEEQR